MSWQGRLVMGVDSMGATLPVRDGGPVPYDSVWQIVCIFAEKICNSLLNIKF